MQAVVVGPHVLNRDHVGVFDAQLDPLAAFGVADRDHIADRQEFSGPFQAEMFTVWLIRGFTVDLVEHMARLQKFTNERLTELLGE